MPRFAKRRWNWWPEVDRRLAETAGRTAEDAGLTLRDGSSVLPDRFPLFRQLQPGEQRAAGWLTALQCSEKGVAFVGRAGGRVVRLHARRISDVVFVNHSDVHLSVRCGQKFDNTVAVFTYTNRSERPDLVTGTATALEFPPADYVPLDANSRQPKYGTFVLNTAYARAVRICSACPCAWMA